MQTITTVEKIQNPYIKRILANIIGLEPLEVLDATVPAIKRAVRGLSDAQMRTRPASGKWDIATIIVHLSDAEMAMGYRIRMALAQSGTDLQAFDEKRWAQHLHYDTADWKGKFALFSTVRADHMRLFRSLSEREWKRFGIHAERGKETVERIAQMIAGHDINHVKQIHAIRKELKG